MSPREVAKAWVDAFNSGDVDALVALYRDDAVNHQVALEPVEGCEAIRAMFTREFSGAKMVCIVEQFFEDGECGFFRVTDDKIAFQRGYWDRLSFLRLYGLPLPDPS